VRELPILAAGIYLLARPTHGPFGLDRFLGRVRGLEKELKVGIPLVLVASIIIAALVVPGLTGLVDLPQAAAPDQVSVSGPARSASFPPGSTLPDFSAPALYGGTISWRTYHSAPTVLVVWAAWCPDCRAEVPLVAQVMSHFPGVRLVSIVTAAGEVPGPTPEQFMRSHDLSFPVALDTRDDRLADALGVEAFPTVYYVRADGTVSKVTVGATPEAAVRSSIQAIAE
jgi:thiol-disulfide isomerase/thioredoxin